MQEILHEDISREEFAGKNKKRLYFKRLIINLLILGILAVALYVIQLTVTKYSDDTGTLSGLIPSIILTVFNLVLPVFFEILGRSEEWSSPFFLIQVSVLR